jgi:hypothetical protein
VGGFSVTIMDGQIGAYLPLISDPDTRLLLEQTGGPGGTDQFSDQSHQLAALEVD